MKQRVAERLVWEARRRVEGWANVSFVVLARKKRGGPRGWIGHQAVEWSRGFAGEWLLGKPGLEGTLAQVFLAALLMWMRYTLPGFLLLITILVLVRLIQKLILKLRFCGSCGVIKLAV